MSKKTKTPLEIRAENLVKDEDPLRPLDSDEEFDEEESMLKKERRAGESLYEFLERQTKDQIRNYLGKRMKDVPNRLVQKMGMSDVAKTLRQKNKTGSPVKRGLMSTNKENMIGTVTSPLKSYITRGDEEGQSIPPNYRQTSKRFQAAFTLLSNDVNDKLAVENRTFVKFDELKGMSRKLRQLIDVEISNKGPMELMEKLAIEIQGEIEKYFKNLQMSNQEDNSRILETLDELFESHQDEKNELTDSYDEYLNRQINKERQQVTNDIQELKQQIDHLSHENRILEQNYKASLEEGQQEIYERARNLEMELQRDRDNLRESEIENSKLKHEIRNIASNYERELTIKDRENKDLRQTVGDERLRRDYEILTDENRGIRDDLERLHTSNDELHRQIVSKNDELDQQQRMIRTQGDSREHELLGIIDEQKRQIEDRDRGRNKQKNEWAEIYGAMKQEIEELKSDITLLSIENDKLNAQLKMGGKTKQSERDIIRKLKKRELECAALWDTLKDMNTSGRGVFDARQLKELLSLRALDIKAKRKLGI